MNHFDSTNNISLQFGHRGKVAIFIDGNNLFHAARFHNIDIDYNKLLRVLLGDGRLFRAFFYTGVDAGAERQQGFLLWMRRNGFRVVQKELKTFYDGSRKANLDVEIAERVRKDFAHGVKYEERDIHVSQQPPPPAPFIEPVETLAPPCSATDDDAFHPPIGSIIEADASEGIDELASNGDFIRVTDDQ